MERASLKDCSRWKNSRSRLLWRLVAGLAMIAVVSGPSRARAQDGGYATTLKYVIHFYPRWFTYWQEYFTSTNRLVGPDRMAPIYHDVVAPNDDTLYVSSFMELTQEPMILTIPTTKVTYSLLVLDPYGDVITVGIDNKTPGTYALTGPDWNGTLPAGVTQIAVPLNLTQWIIRADKFSPSGKNQIPEAAIFRSSLRAGTLTEYLTDPSMTTPVIVPVELASIPFKGLADILSTESSIEFLKELQTAVASAGTPPLSPDEQLLSDRFNQLFEMRGPNSSAFTDATRKAHSLIVADYVTHRGTNKWIHFTNIGIWSNANDLDRSAITEFIQYGNGIDTAAYYQTFNDGNGAPLIADLSKGYVLTFPAGQTPETTRFWSVTAYIPGSITLVSNNSNKYVVGSYTPGLQANSDGSTSIYMFSTLPKGVPTANWLPVPRGRFNIMLRDYGPAGSVANDTYIPPPIVAMKVSQLSH
jgi:hypothetical protein